MAHARKTLTQYADELEQWVAQGWLTGQETFIDLQDMATLTDIIYQEARPGRGRSRRRSLGSKAAFRRSWPRACRRAALGTILEALTPTLETHPGMWPGMALYWLRRQMAA